MNPIPKKQLSRTVQIGRSVVELPQMRPPSASALARLRALEQENQDLRRANEEQRRERAEEKHRGDCETVALLNAQAAGLDRQGAVRVANTVENQRRRFAANPANAGKAFEAYRATREAIARVTGGPRPVRDVNPLDVQLPPPRSEARLPPSLAGNDPDAQARERQHHEAAERGRRLREAERLDREKYRETLRRLGLTDPSILAPCG